MLLNRVSNNHSTSPKAIYPEGPGGDRESLQLGKTDHWTVSSLETNVDNFVPAGKSSSESFGFGTRQSGGLFRPEDSVHRTLSSHTTDSWLAIINPESANARTRKLWPGYYEALRSAGWAMDFVWTERPGHATEIASEAVNAGYKRILAVGGDGTINEIVNGIFSSGTEKTEVEMALLSCGTGGDFVKTLNIPRGIDGLLEVLRRGNKRRVDVGRVEFAGNSGKQQRYFLNVADAGMGGETVDRVNRQSKRWGGKVSFLLGSVQTILSYRNKNLVCHVDGKLIAEGLMNSIMVANGRFIGGGMQIAPQADLSDGLFDIVLLGNFSTAQLLYHIPKIYRGTHLNVSGVALYRGKTVTIEAREDVLLDIDGEQPGRLPARFDIMPQAVCLWG